MVSRGNVCSSVYSFSIISPSSGSLCSDAIGNGFPRKQKITRDASFLATLYSLHDCFKISFKVSLCMKESPLLEISGGNIRHAMKCVVVRERMFAWIVSVWIIGTVRVPLGVM